MFYVRNAIDEAFGLAFVDVGIGRVPFEIV